MPKACQGTVGLNNYIVVVQLSHMRGLIKFAYDPHDQIHVQGLGFRSRVQDMRYAIDKFKIKLKINK